MDAVTLAAARTYAAKQDRGLRRRDLPGRAGLPTVMTSPPTVTLSAASATTSISGSVLIPPSDTSAFAYRGAAPKYAGTGFPSANYFTVGYPSGNTSVPPWAVEFSLDTPDGQFEILSIAASVGCRVMVNGQYATAGPSVSFPSGGATYRALVNLGAAGVYRIKLEFDGNLSFGGIQCAPTSALQAPNARPRRIIAIGDSYTEPTIIDATSHMGADGWVQLLAYMMGCDTWSNAKGGTGYLNPGSFVKFRSRLAADVIPYLSDEDEVWWAGGINDYAYSSSTATAIAAEALLCWQQVAAAKPKVQQRVLSPFYPRGMSVSSVSNLLATADALKANAVGMGLPFYDLLRMPATVGQGFTSIPADSISQNSITAFASNTIISSVKYPLDSYLQIGSGTAIEIRKVSSVTGTGPYTHTMSGGNWGLTHPSGEPVKAVGPSYLTGSGFVGSTTGNGNADRFTGTDGTHPTVPGHRNIALAVYRLVAASLPA